MHLLAATCVLMAFGAVMGAAVGLPWSGAAVGLAVAAGFVIFLGD